MYKDTAVADYVREHPRISYAQDREDGLHAWLIRSIEVLMGRRKVEFLYHQLKNESFDLSSFFGNGLSRAGIDVRYDKSRTDLIPKTGPLVFVANHPFGVVDGTVLCDIALKTRGEFKILVHSMLCQDADLSECFLPIDFSVDRSAMVNNIRTKNHALDYLRSGGTVIVFPGGEVSTANRFGLGRAQEAPWSTFAAKLIKKTRASVIPFYFHGQNSRLFHIASHFNLNFRTGLLIREALIHFNKEVELEVGLPIPFSHMENIGGRKKLTHFLYQQTLALGLQNTGKAHS